MGYLQCRGCAGRGLLADNSGPCADCDGYGILIREENFRLLPGGGSMDTAVETKAETKPFEYYPPRQLQVRDETLILWRKGLEEEEARLLQKIREIQGGMAQIDAELAQRRTRKARS